jgi:hypothetical protein
VLSMPPAFALSQDQTLKFIPIQGPKSPNQNKPTSTHLHNPNLTPLRARFIEHMHNASSYRRYISIHPNIDPARPKPNPHINQ